MKRYEVEMGVGVWQSGWRCIYTVLVQYRQTTVQ
jgi:hypothetical protein